MLNRETVDFLKVANKFTNSMVLKYPLTVGNDQGTNLIYKVDLSKLDDQRFEHELGIFNLSGLLNVFKIFDAYDVDCDGHSLTISDTNTKVNYILSSPSILTSYTQANPEMFDKTNVYPTVLEFILTVEDLNKLKIVGSSFPNLNTVVITGGDTSTISLIQTQSTENMSSDSITIDLNSVSEKNFKVYIQLSTLAKLPTCDYKVTVKYNENNDKYRAVFDSVDKYPLTIMTALTQL